jgi:hypothetical protein
MTAIRKRIVVDEQGRPREVIISWAQFQELSEALGLDLDTRAKMDLRATRRDLKRRNAAALNQLSGVGPNGGDLETTPNTCHPKGLP